ncbi:hypothetical protein ZIOFF_040085 [Zingiber officinale]|uniref:Uncharacterized protein n=1 Tax=Zingiber officinale TaxID=94328 RepID=A0A8J5GAS3_ZINOF|nr:hypothetical protein ZIOFF_040085 [Zingiber officinale]
MRASFSSIWIMEEAFRAAEKGRKDFFGGDDIGYLDIALGHMLCLLLNEERADVVAGSLVVLDVAAVAERERARSPAPDKTDLSKIACYGEREREIGRGCVPAVSREGLGELGDDDGVDDLILVLADVRVDSTYGVDSEGGGETAAGSGADLKRGGGKTGYCGGEHQRRRHDRVTASRVEVGGELKIPEKGAVLATDSNFFLVSRCADSEKGLKDFIQRNPSPSEAKARAGCEESITVLLAQVKPKLPKLPLFLPGMIVIVKNPKNPFHMYSGIV